MRIALQALTEELRRLKHAGVKRVNVSDESIAALRRMVAGQVATPAPARGSGAAPAVVPVTAPVRDEAVGRRPAEVARAVPASTGGLPTAPTIVLPKGDKETRWTALRDLVFKDPICQANVRVGKKVVLGVGSLEAKIMFVGEAPGAEEEIRGEPFVGPAGQLLTKMIQGMGLKREEVYIGNIMNWRPQISVSGGGEQIGNRPPSEDEMRYCLPYLRAQIDVVNPDLLVALGSTAAQGLLGFGSFKTLGEIRGQWREFGGKPLMVTYHPSYILRNQSNRSKRMIWEDLLKTMERVGLPISEKQRGYFLEK